MILEVLVTRELRTGRHQLDGELMSPKNVFRWSGIFFPAQFVRKLKDEGVRDAVRDMIVILR